MVAKRLLHIHSHIGKKWVVVPQISIKPLKLYSSANLAEHYPAPVACSCWRPPLTP